jgi:hypothetical protein
MKRLLALLSGALLLGASPQPPTYHQDVTPILAANCFGCHTQGGIGPFPLDDPDWAQKMAPAIVQDVKSGRMPPWPPGGVTPPLEGERRISANQLNLLTEWAQAGAPLGKPPYKYVPIPVNIDTVNKVFGLGIHTKEEMETNLTCVKPDQGLVSNFCLSTMPLII